MSFEVIDEVIDMAEEGMDDAAEGESEMSPEELEEFNEEIAEAKENVENLGKDVEEFKKFSVIESLKEFGFFLGKTAAIGSIFFGVNLALSKIVKLAGGSEEEKKSNKRKLDVVKAITALIKTETDMSKKLLDWMKEHKDDTVTLDGIEVPLEAVFHKYLGPISDVSIQYQTRAVTRQQNLPKLVLVNQKNQQQKMYTIFIC